VRPRHVEFLTLLPEPVGGDPSQPSAVLPREA
jgi:hypothetical protein